jgi:hypothetical protein
MHNATLLAHDLRIVQHLFVTQCEENSRLTLNTVTVLALGLTALMTVLIVATGTGRRLTFNDAHDVLMGFWIVVRDVPN